MAYGIKRVVATDCPPGSALAQLWKGLNTLIGALEGHTHTSAGTAGGSAGLQLGATVRSIVSADGKDATGAVVVAPGATGLRRVRLMGPIGSLRYQVGLTLNALIQQLDNHSHTAAGPNAAQNTGAKNVTTDKVANHDGRSKAGATVANPPASGTVQRIRLQDLPDADLSEMVDTFNALIDVLDGHVHGGSTAGAGATSAFSFSSGGANSVDKIADIAGRGADGVVVA
jgi:hypothetical protein